MHVGVILVERALVSPIDVVAVLEQEMGVPQVDLSSYAPEEDALALVPAAATLVAMPSTRGGSARHIAVAASALPSFVIAALLARR